MLRERLERFVSGDFARDAGVSQKRLERFVPEDFARDAGVPRIAWGTRTPLGLGQGLGPPWASPWATPLPVKTE